MFLSLDGDHAGTYSEVAVSRRASDSVELWDDKSPFWMDACDWSEIYEDVGRWQ